ncbi:MAG TPA: hypothetical protein QGG11_05085, partial [Candidatus Poseidoniia archaeon]|nr:hypothetical protein [Candidatus Poseidoniia archaeon]
RLDNNRILHKHDILLSHELHPHILLLHRVFLLGHQKDNRQCHSNNPVRYQRSSVYTRKKNLRIEQKRLIQETKEIHTSYGL